MATGRPPTKASLILGAWDPCVTPCATDLDGNGVTGYQAAGSVGQLVWLRIRVGCCDGPTLAYESCRDTLHD